MKMTQTLVPFYVIREISLILVTTITTITSVDHSVLKICKIICFKKTIYIELNFKLKTLHCFKYSTHIKHIHRPI